jgi:hypothetical protein
MSVVNFGEFKELKEIQKCEESYGRYLKTLGNSQLEIEVNSLLKDFSDDAYGKDFFSKGRMILTEINSRAQGPVKTKFETLSSETLKLI